MPKKKRKFDAVKHLKSLSRSSVPAKPGRPIESKKRRLLKKISEQETRRARQES